MAKRRHKKETTPPKTRGKLWAIVFGLVVVSAVGVAGWKWGLPQLLSSDEVRAEPPTIDEEGVDVAVANAINVARDAVLASPDNSNTWGELGMVMLAHDIRAQADICFQQAMELNPDDARWPYLRARSLKRTQPREAVPLLERSVELCANNPAAPRLTLVELLLELHELDRADLQLKEFLSHSPDDVRARMSLGRLQFMRQDYDACLPTLLSLSRELDQQKQLRGNRRSLSVLLAEVLRRSGRESEADALQQKANSQADSRWHDPYLDEVESHKTGLKNTLVAADLKFGGGKFDESILLLQDAVKSYPDSLWAKIYLARALIRTGAPNSMYSDRQARLIQAVQLLEEALQSDPESVEALFRLGVAKTYQGDHAASAMLYQKATQLKPDFTMAFYNLAQANYKLKKPDEAVQALRMAVATEPNFVQGYKMLGTLLLASRRYDEAEKEFHTALQLSPKNQELARLHGQAKRLSSTPQR